MSRRSLSAGSHCGPAWRSERTQRLAHEHGSRLRGVGGELTVRPDRERDGRNDEEGEERERELRAIAAPPRSAARANPATRTAVGDDARQPQQPDDREVEQHDQRAALDERVERSQFDLDVRLRGALAGVDDPVAVQLAAVATPDSLSVRGVAGDALAKPNGVRRLGLGIDVEAHQAGERIRLEQPTLRRA